MLLMIRSPKCRGGDKIAYLIGVKVRTFLACTSLAHLIGTLLPCRTGHRYCEGLASMCRTIMVNIRQLGTIKTTVVV